MGSMEATVCLFVAVFVLCLWFAQLWGVSLTNPVLRQEGGSIVPTDRKP